MLYRYFIVLSCVLCKFLPVLDKKKQKTNNNTFSVWKNAKLNQCIERIRTEETPRNTKLTYSNLFILH